MKKISLVLVLAALALCPKLTAGSGGAVAGGILGGLALGSIIAASASPREVYVNDPYYGPCGYAPYRTSSTQA